MNRIKTVIKKYVKNPVTKAINNLFKAILLFYLFLTAACLCVCSRVGFFALRVTSKQCYDANTNKSDTYKFNLFHLTNPPLFNFVSKLP